MRDSQVIASVRSLQSLTVGNRPGGAVHIAARERVYSMKEVHSNRSGDGIMLRYNDTENWKSWTIDSANERITKDLVCRTYKSMLRMDMV